MRGRNRHDGSFVGRAVARANGYKNELGRLASEGEERERRACRKDPGPGLEGQKDRGREQRQVDVDEGQILRGILVESSNAPPLKPRPVPTAPPSPLSPYSCRAPPNGRLPSTGGLLTRVSASLVMGCEGPGTTPR